MKLADRKIYLSGHRGLVGSAILRRLRQEGCGNLVTRTSRQLDLREQAGVRRLFEKERPDVVVMAAAFVGGIHANDTLRADFIYNNLAIQTNIIHAAVQTGVEKLLFLGSSCVYPRDCPQPIREDYLLTGPLEPTNEPYAVAKIAGIKLCESCNRQYGTRFVSAMPTNLYGPGDNFDLASSHVLPALLRKAHEAKADGRTQLEIWGSGKPLREFLYVDDLADGCIHLLKAESSPEIVNLGSGYELSITALAELICDIVGYNGELVYRADQPDGTPRKIVDCSIMTALGWTAATSLEDGIRKTYSWYRKNIA